MSAVRNIMLGGSAAVVITAMSVALPASDSGPGRTTPTVISSTARPFPTTGTVPVVTASPTGSSVRSSGASTDSRQENTRKSADSAPYVSSDVVRTQARVIDANAASVKTSKVPTPKWTLIAPSPFPKLTPPPRPVRPSGVSRPAAPKVTYIKGYSFCGAKLSQAQRCIDQGKLTLYYPSGVNTLAGHNYKGWYWIDDLPTGRIVKIQSGGLKGTYKVYGHAKVYDKKFPKSGMGAAVALQTCEDSGIGFSFLRRV